MHPVAAAGGRARTRSASSVLVMAVTAMMAAMPCPSSAARSMCRGACPMVAPWAGSGGGRRWVAAAAAARGSGSARVACCFTHCCTGEGVPLLLKRNEAPATGALRLARCGLST